MEAAGAAPSGLHAQRTTEVHSPREILNAVFSGEAFTFIHVAMTRLMVRRLARA